MAVQKNVRSFFKHSQRKLSRKSAIIQNGVNREILTSQWNIMQAPGSLIPSKDFR